MTVATFTATRPPADPYTTLLDATEHVLSGPQFLELPLKLPKNLGLPTTHVQINTL